MIAHYLKKLISSRHLNYCGNTPARADRNLEKRELYIEYFIRPLFKTKPVIFLIRIPLYQLYNNIHLFLFPYGSYPKQIFYIYNTKPPYLHVILYNIRGYAKQRSWRHSLNDDRIICNKPIPFCNKIQCTLTFSYPTLAKN